MRVTLRQSAAAYTFCVSFHSHLGAEDFEEYLGDSPDVFRRSREANVVSFVAASARAGDLLVSSYENLALSRQEEKLRIMNSSSDAV
jgi:hypothetical protein